MEPEKTRTQLPQDTVDTTTPAMVAVSSSKKSMSPDRKPKTLSGKLPLSTTMIVIVSVVAGFLGGWLGGQHGRSTSLDTSAQTKQQIVLNESQLVSGIAKNEGPSVVSVNVTNQSTQNDLFGFSQPVQQESAGTGFIISSDGIIVTNRHVVPVGSTNISVTLSDGTTLNNITVMGRTSETDSLDIAFLKVNDKKGKTLTPIKIGDSSKIQVGDKVVAIGNALGQFQNTVTEGIISGHGRSVQAGDQANAATSETLEDLFQTDAAINEGNSGGPLVNTSGEVIGINTAIAGDAQSIGFAIPINDVKGLINSILQQGKLLRPYLGVHYVSLTDDLASHYNLNVKRGAYVVPSTTNQASVIAGSPAEKAGLKEGDTITKVNDTNIDENNSLTSVLGRYNVGDTVKLTVIRAGKSISVSAVLAAAPSS